MYVAVWLQTVTNLIVHQLLILLCHGNTGDVINLFVCNTRQVHVMAEFELKMLEPAEAAAEEEYTGKCIKLTQMSSAGHKIPTFLFHP